MPDLDELIEQKRWGLIGNGHRYHAYWQETTATWCGLGPIGHTTSFEPPVALCCGNCLRLLRKEAEGA